MDVSERYARGETLQEIADDLGISREAVRRQLGRKKVEMRPRGQRPLRGQVDVARALLDAGETVTATADALGVSRQAVHRQAGGRRRMPAVPDVEAARAAARRAGR